MKKYNKVGLVIAIVLVGLTIMGIINSAQNESDSTNETMETQAIKMVQNFNGSDGKGATITEVIVSIINVAYAGESIFDNPSTKFSWDSLSNFERRGTYDVYADFKTYDGSKEFHFIVDMNSNTIFAGNELGSSILKVVESEG